MKTVKELRHEGLYEEALVLGIELYEKAKEENDNFKVNNTFIQLGYVYYDLMKFEKTNKEQFIDYFKAFMSYQNIQINDFSTQLYDLIFKKVRGFLYDLKNQDEQTKINRSSEILNILTTSNDFVWCNFLEIKNQLLESFYFNLRNTSHLINLSKWFTVDEFNLKNSSIKILENGKKMMSLKEMLYTNIGKVVVQDYKNIIESDKKHVLEVLESLNHSLYIYIPYYLSKIYSIEKNKEKSRSFLLSTLKKMSNTFWIWSDLAETFDDIDYKIICLTKSVSLSSPEEMKLNDRLNLASLLAQTNQFKEAKYELNKYIDTANKMNYKIKNEAFLLKKTYWYESTQIINNNNKIYDSYLKKVDLIMYYDIEPIKVIAYFVNIEKNIISFIDENNLIGFFYNESNTKVNIGDILNVKFIKKQQSKPSKILSFETLPIDISNSNFYKIIKGTINVNNEKGFGFVEDIYISKDIIQIKNLKSGDNITFTIRKSYDFKKKEFCFVIIPDSISL